jgi:hypothetical protein
MANCALINGIVCNVFLGRMDLTSLRTMRPHQVDDFAYLQFHSARILHLELEVGIPVLAIGGNKNAISFQLL